MKQASVCCVRDAGDHYELMMVLDGKEEIAIVTIGQLASLNQDTATLLGRIIRGSVSSASGRKTNGQDGKYIEKVYRHTTVNTLSSLNGQARASR